MRRRMNMNDPVTGNGNLRTGSEDGWSREILLRMLNCLIADLLRISNGKIKRAK